MTSIAYMRSLGAGGYELVGMQGEYRSRDQRHRYRSHANQRDFTRAMRNQARAESNRILEHWDRAERWQRLFVRRLVRLRMRSDAMSRSLWERGL